MENIAEIIESYNEYIKRIPNGIEYIVISLRNNNVSDALNEVKNFSEGLVWLESAANYFENNEIKTNFSADDISDFLNDINEGLTKGDFFLIADIFEYELLDYFRKIESIEVSN